MVIIHGMMGTNICGMEGGGVSGGLIMTGAGTVDIEGSHVITNHPIP